MMERRALIAVVLMFFVLVLYNMFLLPRRKPAPPPEEAQPEEVITEEADTVFTEPVMEAIDFTEPAVEGPLTQVVVATASYTARFSSLGGVLTSFRLNDYLLDEEQLVELVPDSDRLPLGVALLMRTGDRIDLTGANWGVSAESLYVAEGYEADLRFELVTTGGLSVRKTLKFGGDTYGIGVKIEVAGPGSEAVRAVEFGWQSGLDVTEINRKSDDLRNFASVTLTGEGLSKNDLGKVKKRGEIAVAGDIKWTAVKSKYFVAAVIPMGDEQALAHCFQMGEEAIGFVLEADKPKAGPQEFVVYAGPLDYQGLKSFGLELEKAVDFGWKWIQPLSKLIFRFMLFCHRGIPNYGLVILLLSTLTKLLFYPLTQKSFKSMRDMQRLQPKVQELREQYKKDAQKLNQEMMKLYREHGVNPLGGCFPLLLQMPVFISLFQVLSKTIELRRAPFVLWINDLSAPDVAARLPFSLPFIGNAVSVLPILMGIAMFVQQKMSTTDPKQAAMTYMLPIVFTIMFFRFPSGLVLYWLVNNILTIGHQYLMTRAERSKEVLTTGG